MRLDLCHGLLAHALSRHRAVIACLVPLVVYFIPFALAGEDLHIPHLDRLDFFLTNYKILSESGQTFNSDPTALVPQVMNGLPRSTFPSPYKIVSILYFFFDPLAAYLINYLAVIVLAYLGTYLLVLNHIVPGCPLVASLTALCFSLLPFFTILGLSVAGQPLIFNSFINICRKAACRKRDLAVFLLFPFYSMFALAGIFIGVVFAAMIAANALRTRRLSYAPLLALAIFSLGYVASEYQLFESIIAPTGPTVHRVEFARYDQFSFEESGETDSLSSKKMATFMP